LYGAFFVKEASRHFFSPFVISFFCSTLAASILPSQHISIAVARSGGQGRRFFRLVFDGREHGGRLPAIGWLAA
jgi:hypothetical protein